MGIAAKILDIQRTLDIEKTGYDERQGYAYFTGEDVARSVRKEMNRVGVIHRTQIFDLEHESYWDAGGRNRLRATYRAVVTFIDPEDGSEFSTEVIATGSDVGGDKGPRKAQVQAFKIAALDLFVATEGNNYDSDGAPEQEPVNVSKAEQKVNDSARVAELSEAIKEIVNDKGNPIVSENVNAVGRRIAKEVGLDIPDGPLGSRIWRNDANVLEKVVQALKNGEAE